jgi:hypothetical protein
MAAVGQVLEIQKILADSGSVLISEKKTFDTLDDFCKFSGLNGAIRYFVDPDSNEGKQASQARDKKNAEEKARADEAERVMVEAQAKIAEAETMKAKAEQVSIGLENQVDQAKNALTHQKQMSESQIQHLKQQLEEAKTLIASAEKTEDRKLKKYESDQRTALELTRIEKDSQKEENKNFEQNKESAA